MSIIPITKASLKKMPNRMARRMRPGLRPEVVEGFEDWVEDMGYEDQLASPMLRQFLFEAFVGGWGGKTREYRRKMESDE